MPKLYMLLALLFLTALAKGQYAVMGTVRDEKGEILPGATVFITGTKFITACDNNGNFSIGGLSAGSYAIAVKMMGFNPLATSVIISNKALNVVLRLTPDARTLKQVIIVGDNNWQDRYQIFRRYFLGTTPNAAECKIINPKILYFRFDKQSNILSATADDFLIIENNALGYRIKYLLNNFEYNEQTHLLKYDGYPSFQDLEPKSAKLLAYWQKNRKKAYNGSVTHFIKAVFQNKPYASGYELFKIINKPLPGEEPDPKKPVYFDRRPVVLDSLLTNDTEEGFKVFAFKDCLFVLNTKEQPSAEFANSSYKVEKPLNANLPNGQISVLHLLDSRVLIDANGNFKEPGALLFEGYMGWEQIADLVPLEFN
ncbi:carboxypeptidase-like regulatory domain-containing protein [Mucilaginibacter glaciei]|uniref:Carboxypeptidase-like regulatory domain-containing protein n=1 Tax=Mucilaginibacter glaciei TaxID=2772109 RepID=A0A926NSL7_9SPHI|nr:carboxypeptidase-like regulatory domain-containing protein [Mucilaginibacter glaciei]MBD1393965.1 carboxypeptidase-like regulatory domain-containing protein [Mucilaginibacter glaciei]